jgi:thiol-disulfide isomerase/thioredoxin
MIHRYLAIVLLPFLMLTGVVRGAELSGSIKLSDGKPAAGAKIVIAPMGRQVDVTDDLSFDNDDSYHTATCDDQGIFHIADMDPPHLLVAIHPGGYVLAGEKALKPGGELKLLPWCRVEGRLMVGGKPKANEDVEVYSRASRPDETAATDDAPTALFLSDFTSDQNGRITLTHMPAGEVMVAENHKFSWGQLGRPMVVVEASPDKVATVQLGGVGRPVVGRVIVPPEFATMKDCFFYTTYVHHRLPPVEPPMPQLVKNGSLLEQANWWAAFQSSPAGAELEKARKHRVDEIYASTYGIEINSDGTYRIDDVVTGDYEFSVLWLQPQENSHRRTIIASADIRFTVPPVPEGRSDKPVEVAPVTLHKPSDPGIGDAAPDFSVPGIDGRPIKLSDLRGKYVLLDFWATWCGPCIAEMPNMIDTYNALAHDANFEMIGLSLDENPAVLMDYVRKNAIPWRQGHLGNWDTAPVVKDYGVGGIPSVWLIGPDGRIIAKELRGEDIKATVLRAVRGEQPVQ